MKSFTPVGFSAKATNNTAATSLQIDDATSYVVQCKHYPQANFSRANIEEAVNLFTDHWESHWEKHKAKRFYLAVSRPITTNDQLLAIQEQIERLANDFGVTFIYLDRDDLRDELKPHRDLVREYLDEYWRERICPPDIFLRRDQHTSKDCFWYRRKDLWLAGRLIVFSPS